MLVDPYLYSAIPTGRPRCTRISNMPPRLNKRQLREQEELAALEAAKQPDENIDEEEESEQEVVQPVKSAGGGFAAVSHRAFHPLMC